MPLTVGRDKKQEKGMRKWEQKEENNPIIVCFPHLPVTPARTHLS